MNFTYAADTIFAGVVLVEPIVISSAELISLSTEEFAAKYDWLFGAPNLIQTTDITTDSTTIKNTVPVITTIK